MGRFLTRYGAFASPTDAVRGLARKPEYQNDATCRQTVRAAVRKALTLFGAIKGSDVGANQWYVAKWAEWSWGEPDCAWYR